MSEYFLGCSKLIGILVLMIGGFTYYMTFHFMQLDENKILEDSRKAFEEEAFNNWVFSHEKELTSLTKFMLVNAALFVKENQKEITSTASKKDGTRTIRKRLDDNPCQYIPHGSLGISNLTIPKMLKDSFSFLIAQLDSNRINNLYLCTNDTKFRTHESLTIKLNIKNTTPFNPHYYLSHIIYSNKNLRDIKEIKSIKESMFKSEIINHDLRYGIKVRPYSGF